MLHVRLLDLFILPVRFTVGFHTQVL